MLAALRPGARGFRARATAALSVLALAGTAWRVWAAYAADFNLPTSDWGSSNSLALTDAAYFATPARVAELAVGALLGLLLCSPGALGWLHNR